MTTSRSEQDARHPVVVVDTREQEPYTFDRQRVLVVRRALVAGDYALDADEEGLVIERKSLDDYVSSVILARDRFLRELAILTRYRAPCVLVEGSLEDIAEHRYRQGIHPNAVLGATWALIADHRMPVLFAGDRQLACQAAEGLLMRAHRKAIEAQPG